MNPDKRLPIATLVLIAANVGVAFLTLLHPEFPDMYGFKPDAPSIQSAFECLFIHQSILHLLGNMIFLAAVGATVEQLSGTLRFSIVYFASGLGGVLVHWLFAARGQDVTPLVGASGCIAGCAAFCTVRYLKLRVPMAPHIGASVAAVSLIWLVLQVLGAFVNLGGKAPVTAFWAHIGGFAVGLILSLVFRAPDQGQIQADRATLKEMGERSPGAVITAAEQQLAERPRDVHALQELAMVHQQLGEHDKEAAILYKLLDLMPEAEQGPILEKLCALDGAAGIPPHKRLALAERHKSDAPLASAALLKTVLNDGSVQSLRPDALLALASLQAESSPEESKLHLFELAQKYPLHPAAEVARAKGLL